MTSLFFVGKLVSFKFDFPDIQYIDDYGLLDPLYPKINENEWIPSEGPMSLGEFLRLTPYNLIEKLFGEFKINEIEKLTRTSNQMENEIIEWLITCEKKSILKK